MNNLNTLAEAMNQARPAGVQDRGGCGCLLLILLILCLIGSLARR